MMLTHTLPVLPLSLLPASSPERGHYGSVYAMCLADRREALTRERVRALRSLLGEGEGGDCTPEWPE